MKKWESIWIKIFIAHLLVTASTPFWSLDGYLIARWVFGPCMIHMTAVSIYFFTRFIDNEYD